VQLTLLIEMLSTLVRVPGGDSKVDGGRLIELLLKEQANIEAVKGIGRDSEEIRQFYMFQPCLMKD